MIIAVVLLVLLFAFLGSSWYLAEKVLIPAPYGFNPEFEILHIGEKLVTLPKNPSKKQFAQTGSRGKYLLMWLDDTGERAYGDLGEIVKETGDTVTREFSLRKGELPESGTQASLEIWVQYENPKADFGYDYEELRLRGITGELQAWWIDNPQVSNASISDGKTAVLLLHGRRRGEIRETMRIMPTLHDLGFPMLSISYRNHSQSDMSPDGLYHYGASEWEDAKTGWDYLKDKGFEKIIIVGFSMGGAVGLELTKHIPQEDVPALILDSPLLDTHTVLQTGARNTGIPDFLSNIVIFMAAQRSGVDYRQLDQRKYAHQLTMPVLLFGAVADTTIPISLVDEFAEKVEAPLTYKRLEGVEHVEPWNDDPEKYAKWVADFLKTYAVQ